MAFALRCLSVGQWLPLLQLKETRQRVLSMRATFPECGNSRRVVDAKVRATIRDLFAFERADFAQTLYLSKVFEALEALDGVDFVVVNRFRRTTDVDPIAGNGVIQLSENQIAVLGANLTVALEGGVAGEA